MPGRGYAEYLTEADWREFQLHRCQNEVELGVEVLGTANEALDNDNLSFAFVTIATALEIALADRVKRGVTDPTVKKALNNFYARETLPARAAAILLTAGVPEDEVKNVLSAIDVRNKIVHEGYRPEHREAAKLRPVMQTIKFLLDLKELKIPVLTNSNGLDVP